MTALFGPRQRAEDFAALVDGLVDGRADGSAATASGTEALGEQQRLLAIVSGLRRQPELAAASMPRPAFAASLREALVTEAVTALAIEPSDAAPPIRRPLRAARPRRLVAAATVAVVVSGSAGMAAAAETSLPNEALYPLKRGMEKVDVRLSRTAAGRGHDLLSQASTRLAEVRGLLQLDPATAATYVPPTLTTFTWQAKQGAEELMAAYTETKDPAAIAEVRTFAASSIETLEVISTSSAAPDSADEELRKAAKRVDVVDEAALDECEACAGELPDLAVPQVLLVATSPQDDAGNADDDGTVLAGGGLLAPLVGGLAPIDPLAPLVTDPAPGAVPGGSVGPPTGDAVDGDTVPVPEAEVPQPGAPDAGGDDPGEGGDDPGPAVDPPETQGPTDQPSAAPPTDGDSEQPTESPSQTPAPTESSDPEPTSEPTSEPTTEPTTEPSPSPSESQTSLPDPSSPAPSDPAASETPSSSAPTDDATLPADLDADGSTDSGALDGAAASASSAAAPARGSAQARGPRKSPPGRPAG